MRKSFGRTREGFIEMIFRLRIKGIDRILIRGKRRKDVVGGEISLSKGTVAWQDMGIWGK